MRGLAQIGQGVGPLISAYGTIAGGQERVDEANAQSAQLVRNAGAAQAVGQRTSANTRLNTRLVQSRQTALAAASGAGVTDPTVEGIISETGARGEYSALTDLYNGNSQAQDMMVRAAYTKAAGAAAASQTDFSAAKTLAGGATTLLDRYGGQLPDWFS